MWNLIFKGFLMYVMCLLSITSFFVGGTRVSFADENKNENSKVSFLKSNDDDDDDEGEDDEEGDGEDGDESHNAGRNCLTSGCHSGSGEEHFSVGGTIYTDADGTDARVGDRKST